MPVLDLSGELDESGGAFMDTAAVIEQLDLVITVDTSIAHLAGGLGAKVWLRCSFRPIGAGSNRGSTTAWYPSMRLFRQQEFDCWPGVFQEMSAELTRLVAERAREIAAETRVSGFKTEPGSIIMPERLNGTASSIVLG